MPDIPQMPRTTRETVAAIWYTLHNGMSSMIRDTHDMAEDTAGRVRKIEGVLPTLWTKAEHDKAHEAYVEELSAEERAAEEKCDRRGVSTRDWIMIGVVIVGMVVPVILEKIVK